MYYIFWNDKYFSGHNSEMFWKWRIKSMFVGWSYGLFLDIVFSKELYKNKTK